MSDGDDKAGLWEYYIKTARTGVMENRCRELLDPSTYRDVIRVGTNQYQNELELYHPSGSSGIQRIIDDHEDLDTIRLHHPAPDILPIKITKITDDADSHIIPTDTLNIHAILPYAPNYQLEAILCKINKHDVIFIKHLTTKKWYYYQNNYTCEQFSEGLSEELDRIIQSRSGNEQRRLIQTAHFLVSMVFYNAVQYIYKKEDDT